MSSVSQLAKRFREVMLDGLWIANTNYKDQLSDVSWEKAVTKVGSLNTIAMLTFHIDYYIAGIIPVFEGGMLEIKDQYSFGLLPIESQEQWENLLNKLWIDSEKFAELLEKMQDSKLGEVFVDEKYGTYQRNIDGMIEHAYYHLGQITLIKKLLKDQSMDSVENNTSDQL
ncbi:MULTISPECIES: DUF1572 domain-containing protein [Chryseobacterium]|uniref:DUF1572 domain-containing protein n=1 Tax=Chryseobacterium TaxID=59732 RepID=UPI0016296CA0|nr:MULTISPECIES: DUF1572 domain-containing protein [Chryseobacterium]MDM1553801.1 DUF1572 domain-containing protein [Chryseobacterium indologenes]